MKILKTKRFAICLVVLFLFIIVIISAFIYSLNYINAAKTENLVWLQTFEGDASFMEEIAVEGIVHGGNYLVEFSIQGKNSTSLVSTNSDLHSYSFFSNTGYNQFTREDIYPEKWYWIASDIFLPDGYEKTLISSEEFYAQSDDSLQTQAFENTYSTNEIVPVFYYGHSSKYGLYGTGDFQAVVADYIVNKNFSANFTQSETVNIVDGNREEYVETNGFTDVNYSVQDYTNLDQMVADIDGEKYAIVPVIDGAEGESGIYLLNTEKAGTYSWGLSIELNDDIVKTQLENTSQQVASIPLVANDGTNIAPTNIISHGDILYVVKIHFATGDKNAKEFNYSVAAFDTVSGEWLDEFFIDEDFTFEFAPAIYTNGDYLTLAITENKKHNFWVFSMENGKITLKSKDEMQFTINDENTHNAYILDAHYNGEELYLIEKIEYDYNNYYTKTESAVDYNSINRIVVLKNGEKVYVGALFSDVYLDYNSYGLNSYTIYGPQRNMANLQFSDLEGG